MEPRDKIRQFSIGVKTHDSIGQHCAQINILSIALINALVEIIVDQSYILRRSDSGAMTRFSLATGNVGIYLGCSNRKGSIRTGIDIVLCVPAERLCALAVGAFRGDAHSHCGATQRHLLRLEGETRIMQRANQHFNWTQEPQESLHRKEVSGGTRVTQGMMLCNLCSLI